jgi:glycosyltransferase involved in cell wall biosynthesis
MQRKPKITLGLLVYNGERYLGQTIDSILSQTYGDFVLLVSDNASIDGTEDICRSYAAQDKRISYIRQRENIGAMGNFNYLASCATTDYFKWCAADDLIAPSFLAICIEFLESQPDFVLCQSSTRTIGFDDRELPNDIIKPSGASERIPIGLNREYQPWQRFRDVLLGSTAIMDLWGVIRTAPLKDTGLLSPYVGYEKVLMAALSLRGRFAELPQKLFSYRIHPDSFSSRIAEDARQEWCNPAAEQTTYPRLKYLDGYFDAIDKGRLSAGQKLLCRVAIGRYLLQVSKWRRVLMESILRRQIFDGNVEILKRHDIAKQSADEINVGERAYVKNSRGSGV